MSDAKTTLTSNLPAPISPGYMPTCALFERELTRQYTINRGDKLIPVPQCQLVISEIEHSLSVLPNRQEEQDMLRVAKQTRKLIGSYPAREVQDAEVYADAISSVFWKYPPDIGWLAIDIITSRLRFLPTRADLFQVMEELVSKRRGIAARAKLILVEHERRKTEADERKASEDRKPLPPETQAKLDALLGRVGKPMPADESDLNGASAGQRFASVGSEWTPIQSRSQLPPDCETRINPETGRLEARR
jgi:hypothetical protein